MKITSVRPGICSLLCAAFVLATFAQSAGAADPLAAQLAEAHVHLQRGRIDEALEVYEKLSHEEAIAGRVAIAKSRCCEARGDWKEATELLAAAAKELPADAKLQARLAEIDLLQGRFEEAARAIEQALAIDADLPEARLAAADLNAALGKLKEADEGYHWFVKYYNRAQPEDAETLLLVARGASQYARWHGVSQIFDFVVNTLCNDALAKDKNCWEAHLIAGTLLLEKYNRAQAIPELKAALAINPRAAEVHSALAVAALQDRGVAEAAQHVARALDANPRLPYALCVDADVKLEDERLAEALESLERALEVNPRDELALGRLAACRVVQGNGPDQAEIDELFANLDNISEAELKQTSKFGEIVVAVARFDPHPGVFLHAAGEELDARKRFDLAERCYRQAIASMPQLSGPKTALGMLYMRTGQIDEARKLLDQAFDADPYHVRVSNMRKVLKLLDGYQTIATEHFVIRIDSQADLILGRYMAEFLEGEYPALVRQFGYEPKTRTQFEIYNKSKGLSAHQWFSARMVGLPWVQTIGASTGMIVALASPTATDKPFNWARVLKHEFVHILTLQETNFNIPHWYTEALAVLSEESPRPELWNQLLAERAPKGDLMNLDNLNQAFARPRTPMDWQMAYCQSRLYAEYMIDKFGKEKPSEMLTAYRDGLSTDEAIPKVFGVKKDDFEKGYRDYLAAIVQKLHGGKLEESMTPAAAEKAYRDHPDDTQIAARYAYELLKLGKRKEARKIALEALEEHPGEPLAAVVMATLELRAEDAAAAIEWLEGALDRDDPHPKVLELLAELRFKQEEFEEAAGLFRLGLERDPEHLPWLKGLAATLIKQKDDEALKPVLERLVVADGDNAGARKRLAQMSLEAGKAEDAARYARMALYIDVMDVDTHRVLARALGELKDFGKAALEWSVALELKPDSAEIGVELARAEAAAGKKDAALSRLKKLVDRHPDFEPAAKLLEELK